MNNIFNMDSKLMGYLRVFTNLLWLNILTVICSLPIITIGVSFTAMHTVLFQIRKNDEDSITRNFFKAFKENLIQSTIIWMIYLIYYGVLLFNFNLIANQVLILPNLIIWVLFFLLMVTTISLVWVFILQSHYRNSIFTTVKNSFIIAIANLGSTIVMLLLFIAPFVLLFFMGNLEPIVLFLGFAVPGYLQTSIYRGVFDKIESEDFTSQ